MGKVVSKVTDAVGLTDSKAAQRASGQADAYMAQVLKRLDDVDIPDIEKQRIALALPELVGELEAQQLEESAMEEIALDPRLREAKYANLQQLMDIADEGGLSLEDKIAFDQVRRQAAADEKAAQDSILQSMAQRGALDSGAQLAAQLSRSQAGADRASQEGDRLALSSAQGRRDALERSTRAAGDIEAAEFARQAQVKSAGDVINKFNTMLQNQTAAQNLANRQRIAENQVALRNQQQMYNKGLQQQQFENRMRKAGATSGAIQNQAQMAQQRAQAQSQADAQTMGGLMTAGAMLISDKRLKDDITKPSSDKLQGEIRDMIDKLKPAQYTYSEDPMDEMHTGIMAQDLERSELGQEFVEEDLDGTKMVDYEKMAPTQLAATADLQDRVSNLEQLLTMLNKRKR